MPACNLSYQPAWHLSYVFADQVDVDLDCVITMHLHARAEWFVDPESKKATGA